MSQDKNIVFSLEVKNHKSVISKLNEVEDKAKSVNATLGAATRKKLNQAVPTASSIRKSSEAMKEFNKQSKLATTGLNIKVGKTETKFKSLNKELKETVKHLEKINKLDGKTGSKSGGTGNPLGNVTSKAKEQGNVVSDLSKKWGLYNQAQVVNLPVMGRVTANFLRFTPAALGATVAIGGATIALAKLSQVAVDSAKNTNIIAMYKNLTDEVTKVGSASESSSDAMLRMMVEASKGTLSNVSAMSTYNRMAAGLNTTLKDELSESLPTFVQVAKIMEQAYGADFEQTLGQISDGFKRNSALRLDNANILVSVEDLQRKYVASLIAEEEQLKGNANATRESILASEQYNEEIKERVKNMTAQEQALATMKGAEEVGRDIIRDMGGVLETNQTRMEQFHATMTNAVDALGQQLQPILKVVLEELLGFASGAVEAANSFGQLIQSIFLGLQGAIGPFAETFGMMRSVTNEWVTSFTDGIQNNILPNIHLLVEGIHGVISGIMNVAEAFSPIVNFVTQVFGTIVGEVFAFGSAVIQIFGVVVDAIGQVINGISRGLGLQSDNMGNWLNNAAEVVRGGLKVFLMGGANLIGALGAGIVKAGTLVLRTVRSLAEAIASYLVGHSPPPEGPLSVIDIGGQRTFEAWLDGFTGVSLRPVDDVLYDVNERLGQIQFYNHAQIAQAFHALDMELRPFKENLAIVKADFEEIAAPAKAALDGINRQIDAAIKFLTVGDERARDAVRALDAQRAAIYKNLELQQQQVDFANIQLALKQAEQVEERTLLQIQLDRLGKLEKAKQASERKSSRSSTKAKTSGKQSSGGDGAHLESSKFTTPGGGGAAIEEIETFSADAFDIGTANEYLEIMNAHVSPAIEGMTGELELLGEAGTSLSDAWNDMGTTAEDKIVAGFNGVIKFFTDPNHEGGLVHSINNFPNMIQDHLWESVATGLEATLGIDSTQIDEAKQSMDDMGESVGNVAAYFNFTDPHSFISTWQAYHKQMEEGGDNKFLEDVEAALKDIKQASEEVYDIFFGFETVVDDAVLNGGQPVKDSLEAQFYDGFDVDTGMITLTPLGIEAALDASLSQHVDDAISAALASVGQYDDNGNLVIDYEILTMHFNDVELAQFEGVIDGRQIFMAEDGTIYKPGATEMLIDELKVVPESMNFGEDEFGNQTFGDSQNQLTSGFGGEGMSGVKIPVELDSETIGEQTQAVTDTIVEKVEAGMPGLDAAVDQYGQSFMDMVTTIASSDDPESLIGKLSMVFAGEGEGSLKAALDQGLINITTFTDGVAQAFATMADAIYKSMVSGFALSLNAFGTVVNEFLRSMEGLLNGSIIPNVVGWLDMLNALLALSGYAGVPPPSPAALGAIAPVAVPSMPEAYKGGMFEGGMLSVGERGRELISTGASKTAVFPNRFTEQVMLLNRTLSTTFGVSGNSSYNTNNISNSRQSNVTVNVNQPMSPVGVRQQLNHLGL